MNPLELGILITVLTLVLLAVIFGTTFAILGRIGRTQIHRAREQFPNAKAVLMATFAGATTDAGRVRVRGNGILVVLPDKLYFKKWLVGTEYTIPLRSIQSIELVKQFMGRHSLTPTLKVNFMAENGQAAAIGWSVRDAESVKQQIETLMK